MRSDVVLLNEQKKEAVAQLRGGMASETKHRDDLAVELHSNKYKNIAQRLKHKLIEHKTTVMANTDLDSYYKALDKALMHYHAIKMKSINETLKEYWRATYRGKGIPTAVVWCVDFTDSGFSLCLFLSSDIDEISIHSDCTQLNKGKRQYNYRVVMKQGDTGMCESARRESD